MFVGFIDVVSTVSEGITALEAEEIELIVLEVAFFLDALHFVLVLDVLVPAIMPELPVVLLVRPPLTCIHRC